MTKFRLLEALDSLYHKSGNRLPLRWACDKYDDMLTDESYVTVDAWAKSCGYCKGYPDQSPDPNCPYAYEHKFMEDEDEA